MPNPNDPFNTMFNSAMKAAANDPVPVPGSPFYPVFTQARQGKVPEVQTETVYDDMPKLKPFVPSTPFGTDIAATYSTIHTAGAGLPPDGGNSTKNPRPEYDTD